MTIKCMTCACMSQHIMIPLDVGYSKLSDEAKCYDNPTCRKTQWAVHRLPIMII